MSEREQAWREWSNAELDYDKADSLSFTAGYYAGHASAEAKYAPALSATEAERDLARRAPERPSHLRELARDIDALNDGGWASFVETALFKASRALHHAADYDEHGPLNQLRRAHGRFLNTRDVHELARAVGQILNGSDDVQPESEWKTVDRPGDADG
jgi:hypothetical protein